MRNWFQLQKSDLRVIGTFLLVGGLILFFTIDFFWAVLCFVVSFTCFYQANVRDQKGKGDDSHYKLGDW